MGPFRVPEGEDEGGGEWRTAEACPAIISKVEGSPSNGAAVLQPPTLPHDGGRGVAAAAEPKTSCGAPTYPWAAGAAAALDIKRDLYLAPVLGWMTPLLAALSSMRAAALTAAVACSRWPEASAARASFTAPLTRVLTDLFCNCLRRDWRSAFLAEGLLFGFATTILRILSRQVGILAYGARRYNPLRRRFESRW